MQPTSLTDIWRSEALVDALAARRRIPSDAKRDPVAELLAAFTADVDEASQPEPAGDLLAAFAEAMGSASAPPAALVPLPPHPGPASPGLTGPG
ncbi:MAG: hypothetical protein ACRDNF_05085, partial [Streptosporangiaceae bacterium]